MEVNFLHNGSQSYFSFKAENKDFLFVAEATNYENAKSNAVSLGGQLVSINSAKENQEIFNQISNIISSNNLNLPTATDGGGSKYVWLGANDTVTEGQWIWEDGSSFDYQKWGTGKLGSEPDNYNNQDGLGLGMENWPAGFNNGEGFGNAGSWNDLDLSNELFYIVELS